MAIAQQMIDVIDFGGRQSQLVAQKLRSQQVYCRIVWHTKARNLGGSEGKGAVLCGDFSNPAEAGTLVKSVYQQIRELNKPVLAVGEQVLPFWRVPVGP